jgi:hypothetical protein
MLDADPTDGRPAPDLEYCRGMDRPTRACLRRSGLVAAVLGLVGCGPSTSAPVAVPPGPGPAATPLPTAATTAAPPPAGPAPVTINDTPPVVGDVGGDAAFTSVLAASPAGDWVVLCQARSDTNRDGKIAVGFGHHGELFGDEPAPYLVRGAGLGDELAEFVSADDRGHAVVVVAGAGKKAHLELVVPSTGARRELADADLRYEEGGVFAGDRATFDATGEHVVYSRFVAAAAGPRTGKAARDRGPQPGQRTLVLHRVADGHEATIEAGPGRVFGVTLSGRWVQLDVYDPRPGQLQTISHRSGPAHTVGGRRCWGDRAASMANTERRLAPLSAASSSAAARPDLVVAVGADLVVRDADGGLALARADGGAVVALTPPACAGGVLARDHQSGAVLIACAAADPAPLHLWRDGAIRALELAVPNPPAQSGYRSDLENSFAEVAADPHGARVVALEVRRGATELTELIDLATGRTHAAGDHYPLYQHDGVMVLHQRERGLALFDGPRAAWATLPGTPPDLMLRLGQGRLFAAGRRHDAGADAAPTMVVDLAAATVLGAVPAAPLALSTTGWILAPVPPPPCPPGSLCPARISTGAAEGPLRWMRPTR